jgi:hypothetical protein
MSPPPDPPVPLDPAVCAFIDAVNAPALDAAVTAYNAAVDTLLPILDELMATSMDLESQMVDLRTSSTADPAVVGLLTILEQTPLVLIREIPRTKTNLDRIGTSLKRLQDQRGPVYASIIALNKIPCP